MGGPGDRADGPGRNHGIGTAVTAVNIAKEIRL